MPFKTLPGFAAALLLAASAQGAEPATATVTTAPAMVRAAYTTTPDTATLRQPAGGTAAQAPRPAVDTGTDERAVADRAELSPIALLALALAAIGLALLRLSRIDD